MKYFKRRIVIILFSIVVNNAFAIAGEFNDCHPLINGSESQYIIGYGSLIQTQSKNKTYLNVGENIPVMVKGYERIWNMRAAKPRITFLGVRENKGAVFNGVFFELPIREAIHEFDAREINYCRKKVNLDQLFLFNLKEVPEGEYWIYVPIPEVSALPDNDFPIVQTYIDIFLAGCLEIENTYHIQNYAYQCIDTTLGWSKYWINDRATPRIRDSKDLVSMEQRKIVDVLLQTKLPMIFNELTSR